MRHRLIILAATCVLSIHCACITGSNVDLRNAQGSGVEILEDFDEDADRHGVMAMFTLALPEFDKAVYYSGGWWPAGGNRVYPTVCRDFSEVPEGGVFSLIKLRDGDYLAILPLAGRQAYAWFQGGEAQLRLKLGTHGQDAIAGDIPLLAWARAAGPYQACNAAWKAALEHEAIRGSALMREEKSYPEVFRYLGWCSWEQYKNKINEENMVRAVKDIERSGIPIRYFLMDDGHFDRQSLEPDAGKFPNGYKPLTSLRKEDKIKWFGLWWAFLGQNHGIKAPGALGPLSESMMTSASGVLLPKPNRQDATAFYEHIIRLSTAGGFDFLKVDFMVDALPLYSGLMTKNPTLGGLPPDNSNAIGNPYEAAAGLMQAFQTIAGERMDGLINCNWHSAVCLFNSRASVVGRCSEDYKVGDLEKARGHIYHSYSSTPWLGQIGWGDHDMFHSSDKFAGRLMAVSKAMSGAPVYLSDAPEDFAGDAVAPLAFQDGLLLRPLAPAAPVHEDLFYAPGDHRLYRVIAPLANKAAAIVAYNLEGGVGGQEEALSTAITSGDYVQASGMIQPYPGEWKMPAEGLVIYDWQQGLGRRLGMGYEVSISGFGDRLLQLTPIGHGWSVIGRTDKYLSAAAVESFSADEEELTVRLLESGPFAVWSERGAPKSPGVTFIDAGNGLYKADLPVGAKQRVIRISR